MVLPVSLEEVLATRSAVLVPSNITKQFAFAYTRYAELDQASYEYAEVSPRDLVKAVTDRIFEVTGERRTFVSGRVVRLLPGDYIVARHDVGSEQRVLECVVDLSPAAVPNAEVHYRQHGQVFFRMPCEPGTIAMMPRGPTVSCNHTYVSKLCTGEVVRWIARFS